MCCTDAGLLFSSHKELEKVEDVVSWDMVVAKYIQLQGGQPDDGDRTGKTG